MGEVHPPILRQERVWVEVRSPWISCANPWERSAELRPLQSHSLWNVDDGIPGGVHVKSDCPTFVTGAIWAMSATRTIMPTTTPTEIEVEKLLFDSENPRLSEVEDLDRTDENEIGKALWKLLAADEIVMSITSAEHFFRHEPLMVEERADGNFTVIEGNRRLLAVKAIVDEKFRKKIGAAQFEAFQDVTPVLRRELRKLPCIISRRKDLWQFVGFKHVNGPKPWGSFSKAEFIATVHEKYKIGLKEVAQQIGDRHTTVERLYRGWCVLRQAEDWAVFDRDNRFSKRFAFSHLYTGIEYPNFMKFLGLKDGLSYDDRSPVPKERKEELRELCLWLYGRKTPEPAIKPLITSQNPDLSNLETALGKPAGVKALRAGLSLSIARDASLGDKRLFDDAMALAVQALKDATAVYPTGAEGSLDEIESAETAYKLSGAIVDGLERIKKGERGRGTRSSAE